MTKSKLQNVGGMNLKVRLKNPQFIVRTLAAIILPALAYIEVDIDTMMSSWSAAGDMVWQVLSSPAAIMIIALNTINLFPDPTRDKIGDSQIVLDRETPKVKKPMYKK